MTTFKKAVKLARADETFRLLVADIVAKNARGETDRTAYLVLEDRAEEIGATVSPGYLGYLVSAVARDGK